MVGARGPVETEGVGGGDVTLLSGLVCICGEGVECGGWPGADITGAGDNVGVPGGWSC